MWDHWSQEEIKIAKDNKIKQIEITNCETRVIQDRSTPTYTQHELQRSVSLKPSIKNQLSEFVEMNIESNY